jgi:hypothetical protein
MTIANASLGGKARKASMSADERSIQARNAVIKRWGKGRLKASYVGILPDPINVECAVLEDGTRLISQGVLQTVFGLNPRNKTKSDLPPLLAANNLQPYVNDNTRELLKPIEYFTDNGKNVGYKAEVLPEVCSVYLQARSENVLHDSQEKAADISYILVQSLAKVGIAALVDEATGFQQDRDLQDLQRLLKQYIAEEFQVWTKRFPDKFFKEIYRLHGWNYIEGKTQRPGIVGTFINRYVYEQLPDGVLEVLKIQNPIDGLGQRKHRHHTKLTETGNKHLDQQINKVITLMEASEDKKDYDKLFDRTQLRK